MTITTDKKKALGKIQYPFMIKVLKSRERRQVPQNDEARLQKNPQLTSFSRVKDGEISPLRAVIRQGCPLSPVIQHLDKKNK